MRIEAFQKLTLLDYPTKMACTVFTHGCNFRCPFCHNAVLVTEQQGNGVSEDEVLSYLSTRRGILEGVCVTGGEPLLQDSLGDLLKKIKELGFLIKIDTNGSFPDRLRELIKQGLIDCVAMDIKNSKQKYAATVGKTALDLTAVTKSVELLKSGIVDYEFRTTVVRDFHTLQDLLEIADWLSGCDRYYLQQFVHSDSLICDSTSGYSDKELAAMYIAVKRRLPCTALRGVNLDAADI